MAAVTAPIAGTMLAGSALGALGQTSTSSGVMGSNASSYGFSFTDGATATEQNKEFLLAQQQFNSAEALKNRAWQEYMSDTAYQRAMEDMKKAGLNPILAFRNGGAYVGSGAQASSGLANAVPSTYSESKSQSTSYGVNSGLSYSNFANGLDKLASGVGDTLSGAAKTVSGAVGAVTGALSGVFNAKQPNSKENSYKKVGSSGRSGRGSASSAFQNLLNIVTQGKPR